MGYQWRLPRLKVKSSWWVSPIIFLYSFVNLLYNFDFRVFSWERRQISKRRVSLSSLGYITVVNFRIINSHLGQIQDSRTSDPRKSARSRPLSCRVCRLWHKDGMSAGLALKDVWSGTGPLHLFLLCRFNFIAAVKVYVHNWMGPGIPLLM